MGTMENLRRTMPVLFVFLVIVFVILIVFEWGNASRGGGGNQRSAGGDAIGSVNGDKITALEYQKRVDDITKRQRESNPNTDVDVDKIQESVWNQMVEERLLQQAAEKLGVTVSDKQLQEYLLYDPPEDLKKQFTDSTGTFQQQVYLLLMTNTDEYLKKANYPAAEAKKLKEQLLDLQDYYRSQLLQQGIESALGTTVVPSPLAAKKTYDDQQTKVSGSFVFVPGSLIADSVTVSDKEARDYYEAHKESYLQKASRELKYAVFPLSPSAQDSSVINRRLKALNDSLSHAVTPEQKIEAFQLFADKYPGAYDGKAWTPMQQIPPQLQGALAGAIRGDVRGPVVQQTGTAMLNVVDVQDSDTGEVFVKAQHILIKTGPGISEDSVKRKIQEVYTEVTKGKTFELAAAQYSQDGSAQSGGDLGYFTKGKMVKEFEEVAFKTPVGKISAPFKSQFGYHIIKVNDRSTKRYKLRDVNLTVKAQNNTKIQLKRVAKDFRDKVVSGGKPIDSLGAQMKVQVVPSGPIPNNLAPVANSMELTTFLFDNSVGDVSEVIETKDGTMIVGQISKISKPGIQTFEEAKERVVAKLRAIKKVNMLKDRVAKLRAALAPGDSLGKLSAIDTAVKVHRFDTLAAGSPLPQVGYDYPLSAAVYSTLAPGKISDPIKGEQGYYIAVVNSRTKPNDAGFASQRESLMKQQISQKRTQVYSLWMQKFKEQSEIIDKRHSRQ